MILEYYGVKKSERDLRILLKTTPRFGTLWEFVEKEIKRLGFELQHKVYMSFEELEDLVKAETPVIASIDIEYKKKNIGHVGVVVEIKDNIVVFHDPEKGILKLEKENFLDLWNKRRNKAGYLKEL